MKEFLSQRDIPFVERDVLRDDEAMAELAELGYLTTPVIQVGDEVVVGFNRKRLEVLLGYNRQLLRGAARPYCGAGRNQLLSPSVSADPLRPPPI